MSRFRGLLAAAAAAALLVSCSPAGGQSQEEPVEAQSDAVDPEGGYTLDEQIQELEAATAAMQEHVGQDVGARFGSNAFSPDTVREQGLPRPCEGDGYHFRISFEIDPDRDLEELYEQTASAAEGLGLTENENNSGGVNDRGGIMYGAGRAEGRILVVTKRGHQDHIDASYHTRCSDDETMQAQYEELAEKGRDQLQDEYGIPGQ